MSGIAVGDTFTRTRRAFWEGHYQDATTDIEVLDVFENYTDAWTGKQYQVGVRFRMDDSVHGVSHHSLPLPAFMKVWAS